MLFFRIELDELILFTRTECSRCFTFIDHSDLHVAHGSTKNGSITILLIGLLHMVV